MKIEYIWQCSDDFYQGRSLRLYLMGGGGYSYIRVLSRVLHEISLRHRHVRIDKKFGYIFILRARTYIVL